MGLTVKPTNISFVDIVDAALLKVACPERSLYELDAWATAIRKSCRQYGINSLRAVACFIANMAHESKLVPGQVENLNYSAKRMAEVWSRYAINPQAKSKDRQPNALAKSLANNPRALGNNIYANRLGNGDEASGDGFRFAGLGPGQLTGRRNWELFGATLGMTAEQALDYGKTIEGGVMSFGWFWQINNLNKYAETPGVEDETKVINGGQNGVDDRRQRTNNTITEMLEREKRILNKR